MKERNGTERRRALQYIQKLRKMCVHRSICVCVWLFVCTFVGVRVLKYTRDAILYAPLCAHTYSHTFAGRMRKAAQEMKWKFCFLPVNAQSTPALPTACPSAPVPITRLTAQLLATQFVTRQHCRRRERERSPSLSCIEMRRILFMYTLFVWVCVHCFGKFICIHRRSNGPAAYLGIQSQWSLL